MRDNLTTPRIWDAFLTERDKQVFKASGFGATGGFGKRPALLVIDVSYRDDDLGLCSGYGPRCI